MTQIQLSALTTSAVGGPAGSYIEARSEAGIIDAVRTADAAGEPLLIIGGGSNLLVSDDGFPGTVLKIASEGFTVNAEDSCGGVAVVVQAGHNWDAFVDHAVKHAWSGVEALSGIPGASGATPVQNVGAYGSDVSQTIAAVRTWDRERNAVKTFTNSELKFGYRDSILKRTTVNGSPRYVVLTVEFQLPLGRMSAPSATPNSPGRSASSRAGGRTPTTSGAKCCGSGRPRAWSGMRTTVTPTPRDPFSRTRSCPKTSRHGCRRRPRVTPPVRMG